MYMRLVFQAMNIDVEFYDKYYPQGSYSDRHLEAFQYHTGAAHPAAPGRPEVKTVEKRASGGDKVKA